MAYKLEYLEQLLEGAATGLQPDSLILSETQMSNILRETMEETEKIKALLVREVFAFSREKEIELYIKNYQLGCTHLLDRLYQQELHDVGRGYEAAGFYNQLYQPVLSVLSFIEERFSKYFDRLEKVPDVYLALSREEMRQQYELLERALEHTAEKLFTNKLLGRLEAFIVSAQGRVCNYREIMFYKELVKELYDLPQWEKQANIFTGLQQMLVYLNYNAREFVNDMVNQISAALQTMPDINDRIDRLLQYSKSMNQLQLKPDSSLLHRHPSVKLQLGTWFSEELGYLEHKLAGVKTQTVPISSNSTKPKITCQLPVDQLGIFFKAASDLQLITAVSQKALFEQLAPLLSTAHRSSISADSMRSKSYSPEKKDIEAVKDILMQMFRQVARY